MDVVLPPELDEGGFQAQEEDKKGGSSRVGGWLKSQAAALEANMKSQLEANVKSLEGTMKDIAGGVQKEVQKALPVPGSTKPRKVIEERLDFNFVEKALGLELDLRGGAVVIALKPGGQAERLEIEVGDRLVAVHGNELPPADESEYFIDTVKQTLKSCGRPVVMTFVREKVGDLMSLDEVQKELLTARDLVQRYEASWEGMKEEARVAREDAAQANKDAIDAVEEAAQLRADLADLQLSKVWAADEAQRSKDEAEKADAEAKRLSADLQRLQERCTLLGSEQAMAESVLEKHVARGDENAAKAQQAEFEVQECKRSSEASRKKHEALASEAQEATRTLKEELYASELVLKEQAAHIVAAKAQAEEAKYTVQKSFQDVEEHEVARKEAESKVTGLNEECGELRSEMERRKMAYSTSDTRIHDLKREVERLRIEVGRYEVLQDWVTERESLYEEIHCVRQEARRHEDRANEVTKRMQLVSEALPEGIDIPELPAPIAAVASAAPEEVDDDEIEEDQPLLSTKNGAATSGSQPLKDTVADLQAQVSALLDENNRLDKQLKARPIVFQFSDALGDDAEQHAEEVEEPLSPMLKAISDHQTQALGFRCVLWMIFGLLSSCIRRLIRGVIKLRRQPFMQTLEGLLRKFNRSLHDRPLLLWVFYGHVIALWLLELSRQAANSKRLSAAQRLESMDMRSFDIPAVATTAPGLMAKPNLANAESKVPGFSHIHNVTGFARQRPGLGRLRGATSPPPDEPSQDAGAQIDVQLTTMSPADAAQATPAAEATLPSAADNPQRRV